MHLIHAVLSKDMETGVFFVHECLVYFEYSAAALFIMLKPVLHTLESNALQMEVFKENVNIIHYLSKIWKLLSDRSIHQQMSTLGFFTVQLILLI